MGVIVIHAVPGIAWQIPFAKKMQRGLANIGIQSRISQQRSRESDIAILLGTTLWRSIESSGDFLLVDRCSFGNTDEWVSLVWNGHGRRGDHRVPDNRGNRWAKVGAGIDVLPWGGRGYQRVLCGQTRPYSPDYQSIESWYQAVQSSAAPATHFRSHPAGDNPTGLPAAKDWSGCGLAITLNSSVAVEAVMCGIPAVTMDEASMAWPVCSHVPHITKFGNRATWLEWLAWTQWHHDEVANGEPIKHLFGAI